MCKSSPYITEEFCKKYSISYRPEIANYTLVPIALGMVLTNSRIGTGYYGSDEWRKRFDKYMLDIYQRDCDLSQKYKNESEDWKTIRKQFYDSDNYPKQ